MFNKMVIQRYSLWALTCLVGLTGCANLQDRMGRTPGTAASMPPPPSLAPATLSPVTPDTFGAPPPPPVPPPASAITQPPPMSAEISSAPARSSSASPSTKAKADKLYNPEKKESPSVASRSSSKNSTLARLANKATPAKLELNETRDSSPRPAAAAVEPAPAKAEVAPAVATKPKPAEDALPAPAAPAETADVDTSFLATPVRKGEGGAKEKSPQSNLAPEKKAAPHEPKPAIVPVSNPVEDPADFDTRSYS